VRGVPELPEVENLRRQIAPLVEQRRVEDVLLGTHPRFSAAHQARGSTVHAVSRRGKYLLAGLSDGRELILHLGMTGQLRWRDRPEDHVHLGIVFANGVLWFRDPRRFGRALVVEAGEYSALPTLARLGPEPGTGEFSVSRVEEFLGRVGPPVKARLLDQRLVAGVGNYIADEVLWHAGISPTARSLTVDECRRIHAAVEKVVEESVSAGGVSERDYLHVDGSTGSYGSQLRVHGRAGEPCRRCDGVLRHGRVAGRGTVWCPVCQPSRGKPLPVRRRSQR